MACNEVFGGTTDVPCMCCLSYRACTYKIHKVYETVQQLQSVPVHGSWNITDILILISTILMRGQRS